MTTTRPQFEGFAGTTEDVLSILFKPRFDQHLIHYRWAQLLARHNFPQPTGTTPNDQPTTHP